MFIKYKSIRHVKYEYDKHIYSLKFINKILIILYNRYFLRILKLVCVWYKKKYIDKIRNNIEPFFNNTFHYFITQQNILSFSLFLS